MMFPTPSDTVGPWAPEALSVQIDTLYAYRYVVVEEIVDETVLLRSWPWPAVDQRGRLVWTKDSEQDMDALTIDIDVLRGQLYLNNDIRRRPRVGDVFAVQTMVHLSDPSWRHAHVIDLREVVDGAVYDVSADAREAAKIAYAASLTAIAQPDTDEVALRAGTSATIRARAEAPLPILEIAPPPERLS